MTLAYAESWTIPIEAARIRKIAVRRALGVHSGIFGSQLLCVGLVYASVVGYPARLPLDDPSALLRFWLPAVLCCASWLWLLRFARESCYPACYAHIYRNLTELGQLDAIVFAPHLMPNLYTTVFGRPTGASFEDWIKGYRAGPGSLRGRLDALLLRYSQGCKDMKLSAKPVQFQRQDWVFVSFLLPLLIIIAIGSGGRHSPNEPWFQDLLDWIAAFAGTPWLLALLLAPVLSWNSVCAACQEQAEAAALADALDTITPPPPLSNKQITTLAPPGSDTGWS